MPAFSESRQVQTNSPIDSDSGPLFCPQLKGYKDRPSGRTSQISNDAVPCRKHVDEGFIKDLGTKTTHLKTIISLQ